MCFWLITACLGILPTTQVIVNPGLPSPIITPTTTAATVTTTTGRPITMPTPPTNPTQNPNMPTQNPNMPTQNPNMPTQNPNMPTQNPNMPTQNPNMPTQNPNMPTQNPNMPTPNPNMPTPNPNMPTANPSMPPQNPTQPPTSGNLISTPYALYPGTNTVVTVPIICQNPFAVCVTNPNQVSVGVANPNQVYSGVSGRTPPPGMLPGPPPSIDPRLGTTPAYAAPYQQFNQGNPPITGYSGQIPSSSVNFPRNKRNVGIEGARLARDTNASSSDTYELREHRIRKRQSNCACVPAGTCPSSGANFGAGLIDFRIVTPGGGGAGTCGAGLVLCCGSNGGGGGSQTTLACGVTQQAPATAVQPAAGQASFGEYPWQALILTRQNDYVAGGVLVDQLNVITVVHRLTPYLVSGTAPNLKVRLGEWDAAGTYEPVPFQEYNIQRVFTHPSFNSATLQYDIAVLRLSTAVPLTPQPGSAVTINRACLPASSALVYTGQRCWVSGWGKNAFGTAGVYQQILKEVDVPVVDPATCQNSLRTARLGPTYVLDTTSFICAGGELNKDSCTGDGGSGLVCQANGQWTVVGLVSWGLGCAMTGVPGAYVNVAALSPWIQQQIATN